MALAGAALLGVAPVAPAMASPEAAAPAPIARPVDPDAATPRMAPPGGQPRTDELRREVGPNRRGWSNKRRVQLTIAPLYAAYRTAFIGRPVAPLRGGGVALDVDVHLVAPVYLRVSSSYTAHPVAPVYEVPEGEAPVLRANGGVIHSLDVGGGILFAMDLGRVMPMLEAGLGILLITTPKAAQAGQRGAQCLDGGGCDVGLACASDNVCRQGIVPEIHAGAALEILLTDRWTLGASVRYYALLLAPTVFPIYLQAGLRLGVRF